MLCAVTAIVNCSPAQLAIPPPIPIPPRPIPIQPYLLGTHPSTRPPAIPPTLQASFWVSSWSFRPPTFLSRYKTLRLPQSARTSTTQHLTWLAQQKNPQKGKGASLSCPCQRPAATPPLSSGFLALRIAAAFLFPPFRPSTGAIEYRDCFVCHRPFGLHHFNHSLSSLFDFCSAVTVLNLDDR